MSEKGKVIKSRDASGEDFWYVIFPGERAEEFETEQEAQAYLEDMRKLEARKQTAMTWVAAILIGLGGSQIISRLALPPPKRQNLALRPAPETAGLGFIDVLGNLLSSDKLDLIFPPDP